MIFFDGLLPVFRNFVHVEKADADAAARNAAYFADRDFHRSKGKMLEEIMREAKIEGFVRDRNFEHVAHPEADIRKQRACIFNICRAKIETRVVEKIRNAIPFQEAIIICGAAGGFEGGMKS